jgi:hypothetical protein
VKLLIGFSGLTLALPAGGLFGFSQISLLLVAGVFFGGGLFARVIFFPVDSKVLAENRGIK